MSRNVKGFRKSGGGEEGLGKKGWGRKERRRGLAWGERNEEEEG